MALTTVLHLCTKNDTNGNPRRVYVGLDEQGHVLRTEDEGYAGAPDWVRDWRRNGTRWDVAIDVVPSEYKRWLRIGKALDNDPVTR